VGKRLVIRESAKVVILASWVMNEYAWQEKDVQALGEAKVAISASCYRLGLRPVLGWACYRAAPCRTGPLGERKI
jgi:hypothetical protein